MNRKKIGIYIQGKYAKHNYANECFDTRIWFGMNIIKDVLSRAGHKCNFCSSATVVACDIVLVGIIAQCDWYSFLAERLRWKPGKYKIICGGTGVLNIRPLLAFVDVFVWGRAENIIVPLVESVLSGQKYEHESVCFSKNFCAESKYTMAQVKKVYDHEIIASNGKRIKEKTIGCKYQCKFCAYTHHRKYLGGNEGETAGYDFWGGEEREQTMLDMDLNNPGGLKLEKLRMVGMDGFSERLRMLAGKPITKDKLRTFLQVLAMNMTNPHQVKLYNICGYPTECEADLQEFGSTLFEADKSSPKLTKKIGLAVHSTPFRAMPATPAACWEMSKNNFRGQIAASMKRIMAYKENKKSVFFNGRAFWAFETFGTESNATVLEDAILLRGTEKDSVNIAKLVMSPKYWRLSVSQKIATLGKYFNIPELIREYDEDELPSRYLIGIKKGGKAK